MGNNIVLSKNYIPLLDEVYKKASTTTVFNADEKTVRMGANANEILVAKLSMDALKDYSRNSGYTRGNVNLNWETLKFNYDRGIKFIVDEMDNEETIELSFGKLGSEFERTKVVPEGDAFFYAQLAGTEGISKVEEGETYESGIAVLNALRAAQNKMDEDEVPAESRHLRITPTLLRMAQSVKNDENKAVLDEFASIEKVPQTRFYTAIDLLDGTSENELEGGYKKHAATYKASTDTSVVSGKTYYTKSGDTYTEVAEPTGNPSTSSYYEMTSEEGKNINFMIIEKSAVIKYDKHKANNIIRPEDNQESDGYMQKYRKYGIVDTYENKVAGIYLSHKA